MFKKNLLFFVAVLFIKFTLAEKISMDQAAAVARNFYYEKIHSGDPSVGLNEIKINNIYTCTQKGITCIYVIRFEHVGYAIVAGDTRVVPVLGYSTESTYSENNRPPAFDRWMEDYKTQILLLEENNSPERPDLQSLWNYYLNPDFSLLVKTSSAKSVQPMIKTKWNQDKYYNNFCPIDAASTADDRCYAGCVPTAMGQIMNYYRYPKNGIGNYSYTSAYGQLSADFANTTYDFDAMPLEVTERRIDTAVALLLYHLGVSVDLNYGPDGSGMTNHKAAYALRTYFGYNSNCEYIFRDTATHTNWKGLILQHLNQNKPLYYAGWADTINVSGHAFVCDGYQDTTYFHFNWGWGGSMDGYFMIDYLTPGGNDFTLDHELILNFFPDSNLNYPYQCPTQKTLTSVKGTISDGSGPLYNYHKNMDCQWLVKPHDSITGIKFTFQEFDTENSNDYLILYKGNSTSSPVAGTFSGSAIPSELTVNSKEVLIRFVTNDSICKKGWLINYEAQLPVFCSGIKYLSTASGVVTDGSGTYDYRANANCRWYVQPTGASAIQLHFNELDINAGDFLRVSNAITGAILANLSGDSLPDDMICNTSKVLLYFRSYDNGTGSGFSVNYYDVSGIEQNDESSIKVFPNPINENVTIAGLKLDEIYKFAIYSIDGRMIISNNNIDVLEDGIITINTSALMSGTYILDMQSASRNFVRKLIK